MGKLLLDRSLYRPNLTLIVFQKNNSHHNINSDRTNASIDDNTKESVGM